ncbi:TetR/AcrR family transcriptional regulator [Pantoea vagans]|uniref:TetR/AcrR family transcriptional regulator n=1 Tax=Pantoea vagans TaxID=470934 RepID=UPI0028ED04D9|nr:TetR/AcrR family transcriptional regulator [Pantoea vagans]
MTVEKTPRKRLSREDRRRQLLDIAWQIMQTEGSEALTLARVGEAAGVSKPVVYDHFTTRHGLLAALYDDFDRRQTELMDAAMSAAPMQLQQRAEVLAACYVDCVMTEGREIPELISALSTSPELSAVKRHYQLDFIARCQRWLAPFTGSNGMPEAGMWGLLGGADAIAGAVARGDVAKPEGEQAISAMVVALVECRRASGSD